MIKNTVSLIGGHFSRNGVQKDWPARVVFLNGGFGMGDEHQDTMVIFRTAGVAERPSDLYTHPLAKTIEFAEYHYQKSFKKKWDTLPAGYIKTFTNEACGTDRHEMETYIAYERNMCQLAHADGHRLGIGKLASGTPRWDSGLWQELYAPWLVEAWDKYRAIYTRHIYGYPNESRNDPGNLVDESGSLNTNVPTSANRIIDELDLLKSFGWGGGVAFTETGLQGGYGVVDWNRFYFQITKFEQVLRPYADHVIGFCFWECGQTDWDADYTQHLKEITPYMTQNLLPKWEPATEPPPEKHKAIVVKLPQDATPDEMLTAVDQAFEYRHTFTQSHDDTMTLLRGGNADSFVKFSHPERDLDTVEMVEDAGYNWQPLYDDKPEPFRFAAWPTPHKVVTQEFLANPQNYAQFGLPGHDGVDIRAYHGDPVYAVADGVVTDIIPLSAGHNYGLAIRVQHADDYQTTYAHLKEVIRSVGEAVAGGDLIGLADNTGNSNGDHLHLTLKQVGYSYTDRCGNLWPSYICDPTQHLATFSGVNWPGGAPGFDCPGTVTPPPTGNKIDLLPYIKGDGRLYEVRNSSGSQERFQTQDKGAGKFWQTKNGLAEQLMTGESFIYRGWDTSPGNGRYYVQQQNGTNIAQWLPRHMAINEVFTVSLRVQFYDWNCQPSAENSGNVTDTRRLVAHYPVWTSPYGITLNDVVKIEWVNGGEMYYYARNFGLVGWGRTHSDPNTPASSAISEVHAAGARPDNVVSLPSCLA